jgi:hypothetical protein
MISADAIDRIVLRNIPRASGKLRLVQSPDAVGDLTTLRQDDAQLPG